MKRRSKPVTVGRASFSSACIAQAVALSAQKMQNTVRSVVEVSVAHVFHCYLCILKITDGGA